MFKFDTSTEDISLKSSNGQDQYHQRCRYQRQCQRELSESSPDYQKQDHAVPIANAAIAKSAKTIVSHNDHKSKGTYYFVLLVSS